MINEPINDAYLNIILNKAHSIKFTSVISYEIEIKSVGIITIDFMPVHENDLKALYNHCKDKNLPAKTCISVVKQGIDVITTIYNLNRSFYVQIKNENFKESEVNSFINFLKDTHNKEIHFSIEILNEQITNNGDWKLISIS